MCWSRVYRRFAANTRAATTVEFAFVAFPLLGTILVSMGVGVVFFFSTTLDYAVQKAARSMMTGVIQSGQISASQYQTTVFCPMLLAAFDCNKVIINVKVERTAAQAATTTGYSDLTNAAQTALLTTAYTVPGSAQFCTGQPGDYVYIQVLYPMAPLLTFLSPAGSVATLNGQPAFSQRAIHREYGVLRMRRPPQSRRDPQRTFGRSVSGLAAVEFALLLPVMLIFIFGGVETVRAITCARRLTYLANAIGQQVTAGTTNQIANADMHFVYNTAVAMFPQVLKDASRYGNFWWQNITISVSSINFTVTPTGCTSGCTYTPAVIWSGGGYRSCTTPPVAATDTAAPSATTLPTDVFGPGSLIVVDLTYTFNTFLSGSFIARYVPNLNSLVLRRSVYMQPRYVPTINYHSGTTTPGSDDIVTWCAINQST